CARNYYDYYRGYFDVW
nr:immunoglobulin heavy chain junction region [Mus musculus]